MKNLTNSGWQYTLKRPFIFFFNQNNSFFKFIRRTFVIVIGVDSAIHIILQMILNNVRLIGVIVYAIFMLLISLQILRPEIFNKIENDHKVFKYLRIGNICISLVFAIYDIFVFGELKIDTTIMIIIEVLIELVHRFLVA